MACVEYPFTLAVVEVTVEVRALLKSDMQIHHIIYVNVITYSVL